MYFNTIYEAMFKYVTHAKQINNYTLATILLYNFFTINLINQQQILAMPPHFLRCRFINLVYGDAALLWQCCLLVLTIIPHYCTESGHTAHGIREATQTSY